MLALSPPDDGEEAGGVRWKYLLVAESDINTAKGSWAALKKLGS